MLPNHAPMVIAEQFGTLEALFPGRIDLGLGRAPGSDQRVARALRRTLASDERQFPQDVRSEEHTSELQSLMRISYAVFCLKKKKKLTIRHKHHQKQTLKLT